MHHKPRLADFLRHARKHTVGMFRGGNRIANRLHDVAELVADVFGLRARCFRELSDFVRHHRKARACLARVSRLNRRIHRQQICLTCNRRNNAVRFCQHFGLLLNQQNLLAHLVLLKNARAHVVLKRIKLRRHLRHRRSHTADALNHLCHRRARLLYALNLLLQQRPKRADRIGNQRRRTHCAFHLVLLNIHLAVHVFHTNAHFRKRIGVFLHHHAQIFAEQMQILLGRFEFHDDMLQFFRKRIKPAHHRTNFVFGAALKAAR